MKEVTESETGGAEKQAIPDSALENVSAQSGKNQGESSKRRGSDL